MATKIPKAVVLELTYRCNHKCLFCSCPWYAPNSSYNKGRELSLHGNANVGISNDNPIQVIIKEENFLWMSGNKPY